MYGLDVWQVMGEGRWGKVARLIHQLPETSRLVTRLASDAPPSSELPDVTRWPRSDRLLAAMVDELTIANWQRTDGKGPKPVLLTAARRRPTPKPVSRFKQEDILAMLHRIGPKGGT